MNLLQTIRSWTCLSATLESAVWSSSLATCGVVEGPIANVFEVQLGPGAWTWLVLGRFESHESSCTSS